MQDFKLYQIYKSASIVEGSIELGAPLLLSNKEFAEIVRSKTINFNKETLLHLFIKQELIDYYDEFFTIRTESVCEEWFELEHLQGQFLKYKIPIDFLKIKYDGDYNPITTELQIQRWYKRNKSKFVLLSQELYKKIFFILFSNRRILHKFNQNISVQFNELGISHNNLTGKGTLKRKAIPEWVRKAVFLRDKGSCSICGTNVDGTINYNPKNYDHIIPLDMFGVNDPTNIQLLCKKHNLKKLNRNSDYGAKYQEWW